MGYGFCKRNQLITNINTTTIEKNADDNEVRGAGSQQHALFTFPQIARKLLCAAQVDAELEYGGFKSLDRLDDICRRRNFGYQDGVGGRASCADCLYIILAPLRTQGVDTNQ